MKQTKTISIPRKMIQLFPLGIVIAGLIVFLTHYFGKWELLTDPSPPGKENNDGPFRTSTLTWEPIVVSFNNYCTFSNEAHSSNLRKEDQQGINKSFTSLKVIKSIEFSFLDHFFILSIFSVIITILLYLISKMRLKIVDT